MKNLAAKRFALAAAVLAAESSGPAGAAGAGSIWSRQGNGSSTATQLSCNLDGSATGWTIQNLVNLHVFNVRDFGATGNGVTDDTAAINAAVNSAEATGIGGVIYFPPGTYRLTKPSTGLGSIILTGAAARNLTFMGDGFASQLAMIGSAGGGDWYMFRIRNGASQIRFINLSFTSNITSPDPAEQNHCLNLSGVAGDPLGGPNDIDVIGCYFGHFVGDCVRNLGENNQVVKNVRVLYNDFDMTASRSAVEAQRYTESIQISFNFMTGSGDQQIDFEPTAGAGPKNWNIVGNHLWPNGTQAIALTISGAGNIDDRNTKRLVCALNTITDGGQIEGLSIQQCLIIGNIVTVNATDPSATANVIDLTQHVRQCEVYGNVAISQNTVGNRTAIRIAGTSAANSDAEQNIIADNIGATMGTTSAGGIDVGGTTTESVVSGNLVQIDCSTANVAYGVSATANSGAIDHVMVSGNMLFGVNLRLKTAIQLACSGFDYHNYSACYNYSRATLSIVLSSRVSTEQFLDWRMVQGNNGVDCSNQSIQLSTNVGVTLEGSAGPGTQIDWINVAAGPEGNLSAPVGSLCTNIGGGQGTVVWTKETGAGVSGGNTGWVPQGACELVMGALTDAVATANRFLAPGAGLLSASATEIQFAVPRPGTIRNLRILAIAGTAGTTVTYTVRKNGVDQTLVVAIANNATSGADLTHSFTVAAGDLISIKVTKNIAPVTAQTFVTAAFELTA